jgi:acyl-CoA thioesterase FadM
MARVQITVPSRFDFYTDLDVRITDINYGNHLANDAVLSLLHEARVRWLRAHNLSEANVEGSVLVMCDAAVAYRAEGYAGDQLRIEVAATDPSRVSCDIVYRITRLSDGKVIAEAKTGVVFLDPESRRVSRLPSVMLALASRPAD